MDFRNKDFRILGLRGFIYKPPKSPKIYHADYTERSLSQITQITQI